jgi:hypothetical protein
MKTLLSIAGAAAVIAAVTASPALADDRRGGCDSDTETALIGGAVGAVLGGFAGSGVAGYGNETNGAVIGALVGAGAGALVGNELGDGDCDRRGRAYNDPRYAPVPIYDPRYRDDRGYRDGRYGDNRRDRDRDYDRRDDDRDRRDRDYDRYYSGSYGQSYNYGQVYNQPYAYGQAPQSVIINSRPAYGYGQPYPYYGR